MNTNEAWKELYTPEQIKNIQLLELRNLKVIIDVCEKLQIDFFLYGGSMIGAVRHEGFVPWDDDLDIAMMRKDYSKFIKEAPALLPNEYFLQSPYTDKNSPYFYTKLRLKGTKCIGYDHHRLKMEQGIYVDIYPIDNLPNDNDSYHKFYNLYSKWVRRFYLRQSGPYYFNLTRNLKDVARVIKRNILWCAYKVIPHSFYVKKIDSILQSSNGLNTTRYGNYFYPKPVNIFSSIYPLTDANFEGFNVKIPADWHNHLTSRYGDYMQMPPMEERIGHRQYLLDFGEYIK